MKNTLSSQMVKQLVEGRSGKNMFVKSIIIFVDWEEREVPKSKYNYLSSSLIIDSTISSNITSNEQILILAFNIKLATHPVEQSVKLKRD